MPRNWLREPGIFRILADDTYDWESWFDPEGKPLWVNHAVERMTGYRVPECLAMENYPLPLVVPGDVELVRDVLAAARTGQAGNDVEFQVKTYTGQTLWVAMSWQSTQDASGRPLGFRTSIRDIQQRKTLELELRDALKAARAGERAREDFLATVSHEMRTPLQCIIGYAELLHQGHNAEDRARYGDVILGQAREALSLIDDLLRLASSASADEIDRVAVQPRAVVEDVVSALLPLAVSNHVTMVTEHDGGAVELSTSQNGLRSITTNLVHNAIKFSRGGRVVVRSQVRDVADGRVEWTLEVTDTGVGIAEDDLSRVFSPFERVHTGSARRFEGTGLGLAIVKRWVDRLGGDIEVRSQPNAGSRFTVRVHADRAASDGLPVAAAPYATSDDVRSAKDAERSATVLRVLVVEDSPPTRELLSEMVRMLGHVVVSASDGQNALAVAQEQPIDIAFVDQHMPGTHGADVARQLRGLPETRHARLVALSANLFQGQSAPNFDAVRTKPLTLAQLQHELAQVVLTGQRVSSVVRAVPAPPPGIHKAVWNDLASLPPAQDGGSMLQRVVRGVCTSLDAHLVALQDALDVNDVSRLQVILHDIKGDCLLVGAREVARAVQRVADKSEKTPDPRALARLRSRLTKLIAVLRATLEPST